MNLHDSDRVPFDREPLNWHWFGIRQVTVDALNALHYPHSYLILADDTSQNSAGLRHWVCLTDEGLSTSIARCHCADAPTPGETSRRKCAYALFAILGHHVNGSVFVWGLSSSRQVLHKLCSHAPELAVELQMVIPCLIDVQSLVNAHVQFPDRVSDWAQGQTHPLFLQRLVDFIAGTPLCAWLPLSPVAALSAGGDWFSRVCVALYDRRDEVFPTLIFAPTAVLQRHLKWGFGRTQTLVEQLQAQGVLSSLVELPRLAHNTRFPTVMSSDFEFTRNGSQPS